MKDIGSIFPLYDTDMSCNSIPVADNPRRYLYALCREILLDITLHNDNSGKCVLVPEYTCSTVTEPFFQSGWKVLTYKINKQLRIDTTDLSEKAKDNRPAVVVAHPYYGQDFNTQETDCLKKTKEYGAKLVIDITQCLYTRQHFDFAEYYVTSLYKWYPMVDGALLETAENFSGNREESTNYVKRQCEAMYLRGCYFESGSVYLKEISRRINKEAIAMNHTGLVPHTMSDFSRRLFGLVDPKSASEQRTENCGYLCNNINFNKNIQQVIPAFDSAPLYYPIYCNDRQIIQQKLAEKQIYAPILWPIEPDIEVSAESLWTYKHLLALPIDQRYNTEDMKRIVENINDIK